MLNNFILAAAPLFFVIMMERFIDAGAPWTILALCAFFILQFPHQSYLFFEIKHLLNIDGIADELDFAGVAVFGGLSIFGLTLQVITIIKIIALLNLTSLGLIVVLPLSFLAALGGCLGLTDLPFLPGFYPPLLIYHLKVFLNSQKLLAVCLGTTMLLTLLCMVFI